MRKLIILAIMVTVGMFTSHAQTGFSAGINGGIPTGDVSDGFNLTLGLDLSYLTGEDEGLRYGGAVSYSRFLGDEVGTSVAGATVTADIDDISFIEIKAVGEYDFSELFYGAASVGYGIAAEGDQDSGFVFSPALGVKFDMLKVFGFYKSVSVDGGSFDNFGVGVGYTF